MNKKWELYVKRIYNRIPNIDNLHIRNAFEAFQWIINNVDYENVQEMVSANRKFLRNDAGEDAGEPALWRGA